MFKDFFKTRLFTHENLQESRRYVALEKQKEKRAVLLNEHRPILLQQKKTVNRLSFKEVYKSDITLQHSEWMFEKPSNFSEWLLIACPKGQRCLVIASNGGTEMYNKAGRWCMTFHSQLPGGKAGSNLVTILDCIFNQDIDTFFVLDAMAFSNLNLLDCEAQFRFFWLRSKFEENKKLCQINAENEKCFQLLECYELEDIEGVSKVLQRYPTWPNENPKLDGFLFYHKEGSYTCGITPLVCWLFAFMIPDVLGISVSPFYKPPAEYLNPLQFINYFEQNIYTKKKKCKQSVNNFDHHSENFSKLAELNLKENVGEPSESNDSTMDIF